jgi:GTP-binding protein HflX
MSSLIINLVDASDPNFLERIESVSTILDELQLSSIPQLMVFNKVDRLEARQAATLWARNDVVVVSALTGEGTESLVERIGQFVGERQGVRANSR